MVEKIVLTEAEFAALAVVDGTEGQPPIPPAIKSRLMDLYLIERRAWPGGPLWRTALGTRRLAEGK